MEENEEREKGYRAILINQKEEELREHIRESKNKHKKKKKD